MGSKCPYCGEELCDGMCRPPREMTAGTTEKPELHQGLDISRGCHSAYAQVEHEAQEARLFNRNHPDVSPEDSDHWMAETLGGVSRMPKMTRSDVMMAEAAIGPGGCLQPLGPVPAAPLPVMDEGKASEILTSPVCFVEVTGDRSVNYEFLNLATDEQIRIVREILPEILNRFLTKNKDYEHFPEADLGPKAHFVGIHRKFGKLRKGLWDEEPLEHEQLPEVIDDFVGHLLLARLGLS